MTTPSVCGCKITHNLQPDKIFQLKNEILFIFQSSTTSFRMIYFKLRKDLLMVKNYGLRFNIFAMSKRLNRFLSHFELQNYKKIPNSPIFN